MFTLYAYVVDIQKVANIIHICKRKVNLYIKSVNGKGYNNCTIVKISYCNQLQLKIKVL